MNTISYRKAFEGRMIARFIKNVVDISTTIFVFSGRTRSDGFGGRGNMMELIRETRLNVKVNLGNNLKKIVYPHSSKRYKRKKYNR